MSNREGRGQAKDSRKEKADMLAALVASTLQLELVVHLIGSVGSWAAERTVCASRRPAQVAL